MLEKAKQLILAQWRRAALAAAVGAATGLVFWLPRLFTDADQLTPPERFGFDLVHSLQSAAPVSEIRIIELDQRSFRARNEDTAALWDRSRHAALVRKLAKDGAKLVVFDVLFDKAGPSAADEQFADAIRAHGKVALAATRVEIQRPGIIDFFEPVFPVEPIRSAAAAEGMVNMAKAKDADGTVRRHFVEAEQHSSLPRAAARLAGASSLPEPASAKTRWLRYYGPPSEVLPGISYVDAFDQIDGYFRDKFVFIGSTLRIKRPGEDGDFFRTPFTRWGGSEAAGVTLVATEFLNLIRGDAIYRAPALLDFFGILLAACLAALGCACLRPLAATGWTLCVAGGAAVLGFLLQSSGQVLSSWVTSAAIVVPCVWAWSMIVAARSHHALPGAITPSQSPAAGGQPAPNEPKTALVARIPDHTLLRAVGRGAYGEVWLARNAVGLYHAVKIIYRREFADSSPFEREFRGVTKFMPISRSHPGFVNILHVGRDDAVGCFYCIMEAADDEITGAEINPDTYSPKNLSRHLHQRRRLPPRECLQLGLQLSAALDHLHKSRLIHRDIKPGNIIFVNGAPKLADIGLVTDMPRESEAVTYLGTMGYIAPEGPGTPLADIYSLGKVLYEAFTGLDREQFPSLPTTMLDRPDEAFPIFAHLNGIILKACEANPALRYQSSADLHTDLTALLKQMDEVK